MKLSNDDRTCSRCKRPASKRATRSLCFACYLRSWRGADLAESCAVCGFGDRRMFRRGRLADGAMVTLCANDAALLGRRTMTLEELRAERFPDGDRRQRERRAG